MMPPAVMAARFLKGLALGAGLGVCYDFLRPLRPRRTGLADTLFLLAAMAVVVGFSFGICAGDLRLGTAGALALGGMGWCLGPGGLLGPVFSGFWKIIRRIRGILLFPLKKFLNFEKNVLASWKKWVTIKWNYRRQIRQNPGGVSHDTKQSFSVCDPAQQPHHKDRSRTGYRIIYGGADRPALDS